MRTKLTILLILTANVLFAQKKITITLTGGTNYMFIPDSLNQDNTKSGGFAYQGGLDLSYRVFKNLKIGLAGKYSTTVSEEIIKKIPEDEIFYYDIYIKRTLKYSEFPMMYLSYDFLPDRKIVPYVKIGGAFAKVFELNEKVLKTDPAGHESDFWSQFFNFTFKDDLLYITDMKVVFAGVGADYKLTDYFNAGIDLNIKRSFYYDFNDKRSNYILTGNVRFSYVF